MIGVREAGWKKNARQNFCKYNETSEKKKIIRWKVLQLFWNSIKFKLNQVLVLARAQREVEMEKKWLSKLNLISNSQRRIDSYTKTAQNERILLAVQEIMCISTAYINGVEHLKWKKKIMLKQLYYICPMENIFLDSLGYLFVIKMRGGGLTIKTFEFKNVISSFVSCRPMLRINFYRQLYLDLPIGGYWNLNQLL